MSIDRKKVRDAAQKYHREGSWSKAIDEYEKLVDDDPTDVRSRLKLAELYQQRDEEQKAVDSFIAVGEHHASQEIYQKAVAVYKQALRLRSDEPELHRRVGEAYHRLGRLKDAAQAFRKAQQLYKEQGELIRQLEVLEELVRLDPEDVGMHIQLAETYAKRDREDDALETFREAAEKLEEEGRKDDYVQVAERILYFDPDDVDVREKAIDIYRGRRDHKRALKHLQVRFNDDPTDVQTLRHLADTFEELERHEKAALVYKQLVNVFRERDQISRALHVCEQMLEIDPDNEFAEKMLQKHGQRGEQTRTPGQRPGRDSQNVTGAGDTGEMGDTEAGTAQSEPDSLDGIEFLDEEEDEGEAAAESTQSGSEQQAEEPERAPVAESEAPPEASAPSASPDQADGGDEDEVVDLSDQIEPVEPDEAPQQQGDQQQEDRQSIEELLSEADVFIKYGLEDKARRVIQEVLQRDPENLEAFDRRRRLYAELGEPQAEASTLLEMARLVSDQPAKAREFLQDARDLGVIDDRVEETAREIGVDLDAEGGGEMPAIEDVEPVESPEPDQPPPERPDTGQTSGSGSELPEGGASPDEIGPTDATIPPERSEPSGESGGDELPEGGASPGELGPTDATIPPERPEPQDESGDEGGLPEGGASPDDIRGAEPDSGDESSGPPSPPPTPPDTGEGEAAEEQADEVEPDQVEVVEEQAADQAGLSQDTDPDAGPPPLDDDRPTADSGGADQPSPFEGVEVDSEADSGGFGDFGDDANPIEDLQVDSTASDGGGLAEVSNPSGVGLEGESEAPQDEEFSLDVTEEEVEGALDGMFQSFQDEDDEPLQVGDDDEEGDLADVDMYIQQGLYDEAKEQLREFEEENPDHPGIDKRYHQIETGRRGGPVENDPSGARSLSKAFEPEDSEVEVEFEQEESDAVVDEEVTNTNLDVGTAYLDMDLYDEAIDEFEEAKNDPEAVNRADYQIAVAEAEKGDTDAATDRLEDLLNRSDLDDDVRQAAEDKLDELA